MKHKCIFVINLSILLLWVSVSHAQFTVRVVFFQPTDAVDKTAEIRKTMKNAQDFFRDEIFRRHGVEKTFRLEEANEQVVVHVIKGQHNIDHYRGGPTTGDRVLPELPAEFKNLNNSNIIFVGGFQRVDHGRGGILLGFAVSSWRNQIGGYAILPANHINFNAVVHEIAHTFGLEHNLQAGYVMNRVLGHNGFDAYETRWLMASKYLQDNPKPVNTVPKILRIHPIKVSNEDMRTLEVSVDVSSPNGVYQAEIASDNGVLDYNFLKRTQQEAAVFFFKVWLLGGDRHAYVRIKDTEGNYDRRRVELDIPPAAFMPREQVVTPRGKPGENPTGKPTKPTAKPKPEPEPEPKEEKEEEKPKENKLKEPVKPRQVKPLFKFLTLWAKLKRL